MTDPEEDPQQAGRDAARPDHGQCHHNPADGPALHELQGEFLAAAPPGRRQCRFPAPVLHRHVFGQAAHPIPPLPPGPAQSGATVQLQQSSFREPGLLISTTTAAAAAAVVVVVVRWETRVLRAIGGELALVLEPEQAHAADSPGRTPGDEGPAEFVVRRPQEEEERFVVEAASRARPFLGADRGGFGGVALVRDEGDQDFRQRGHAVASPSRVHHHREVGFSAKGMRCAGLPVPDGVRPFGHVGREGDDPLRSRQAD